MDVVKLVQESLFEACLYETGMRSGMPTMGQSFTMNSQMTGAKSKKGGRDLDPNNVSMLSIPKQTKFFIDKLRNEADLKGTGIFEY